MFCFLPHVIYTINLEYFNLILYPCPPPQFIKNSRKKVAKELDEAHATLARFQDW